MRRPLHPVAAALLLASFAIPAAAQQRRNPDPVILSAPAGTRIVRPATASATIAATAPAANLSAAASAAAPPATSSAGSFLVASGESVQSLLLGDVPVPGFGFDHTHHAAVNRNLPTLALIDPATQHRLALARQIRGETPRAILLPVFAPVTQVVVMVPPPVVVLPAPAEPPEERVEGVRYVEKDVASAPAAPPLPVRELEAIVFVMRDGTERLAVAFSVRGQVVIYISPDGRRRTLPLSELDVTATLAANEERGTLLTLPL